MTTGTSNTGKELCMSFENSWFVACQSIYPLIFTTFQTHVHPLAEELPSKFTIPTHIITAKMIMTDPVVLTALKEWPNFDKIRDTMDANVVDHLWYQIERPINKGKWHAVPLDPLQISDNAAATADTLEEPCGQSTSCTAPTGTWPRSQRPQKHTRSVAASDANISMATAGASAGCGHSVAALATPAAGYMPVAEEDQCNSPSPGPSATISLEPTTPMWQTQKWWAATRSMTPATGKTTTLATPSSCRQIFDGVVIVTPSWQQSVTPNATPMECMEEEIAALQQQHMEMAQDLLDTHHELANTQQALADTQTKLQMLCNLVEALHQHLYPLPHSSPDAPGPSCPSPTGFAITSHQAVIPTDGARILDLVPTTMVQGVAIDTSILQNLPGDMLLAPSTFLPPPHHFAYSSTAGVGEAQPPIYVSLGAVANHASGNNADDEDAANWMDID
ncbi:hypothetical protein F5J12DRAFT_785304 [Pisolithus orientalis]|uniref:uncharacterized protein n=1 Tax=Pisolithus orientalis TaxID=936130 RepID=UPI002225AFCA|nr:uncharacterized protein F5J12DRAFT_785304 [Pisolithus orientalis]KAI5996889.1 hypothetical protein F5J12DRAFT_785304 [Pisolithus orientalis]